MSITLHLLGEPAGGIAALRGLLQNAGFSVTAGPGGNHEASILVGITPNPAVTIDAATLFASAAWPSGSDRLVVAILPPAPRGDWPAVRATAELRAFTRHAALAWAPRRIRVNAIGLGETPTEPPPPAMQGDPDIIPTGHPATADLAATILAMWRWRSMTGQLIRLGA